MNFKSLNKTATSNVNTHTLLFAHRKYAMKQKP